MNKYGAVLLFVTLAIVTVYGLNLVIMSQEPLMRVHGLLFTAFGGVGTIFSYAMAMDSASE